MAAQVIPIQHKINTNVLQNLKGPHKTDKFIVKLLGLISLEEILS